jgi:hypothetical protein
LEYSPVALRDQQGQAPSSEAIGDAKSALQNQEQGAHHEPEMDKWASDWDCRYDGFESGVGWQRIGTDQELGFGGREPAQGGGSPGDRAIAHGRLSEGAGLDRLEGLRGAFHQGLHVVTNLSLHIDGDTATDQAYWETIGTTDCKSVVEGAGHYEDTLKRENGHWRFYSREIFDDLPPRPPAAAKP